MHKFLTLVFQLLLPLSILAQSAESDTLYNRARALYDSGKYTEAIPLFTDLLAIDRRENLDNDELIGIDLTHLASCYYNLGRIDSARKYDPNFYELEPVDRNLYRPALEYPKQMADTDSPQALASLWRQCLETEKQLLGEKHYFLYGSYCALANFTDDINELRHCLKKAKEIASHYNTTSTDWKATSVSLEIQLAFNEGHADHGVDLLSEIWSLLKDGMKLNPSAYYIALGYTIQSLVESNDIDKAAEYAYYADSAFCQTDAVTAQNFYPIAMVVADFAIENNLPQLAIESARHALKHFDDSNPEYNLMLYYAGYLEAQTGAPERALELLTQAITNDSYQNPQGSEYTAFIHFALGDTYDLLRRFDEALSSYRTALEFFKQQGDNYIDKQISSTHRIATICTRTNDFDKAVDYLHQCLTLMENSGYNQPSDRAYIFKDLGACLADNHPDEAIRNYNQAIGILKENNLTKGNPTFYVAMTGLLSLQYHSNPEAMEKEFENLYALCEREDELLSYQTLPLIMIEHIDCLSNNGNYSRAVDLCDRLIDLIDDHTTDLLFRAIMTKGQLLATLGDVEGSRSLAKEQLIKIKDLYPVESRQYLDALIFYYSIIDKTLDLDNVKEIPELGKEVNSIAWKIFRQNDPLLIDYIANSAIMVTFFDPQLAKDYLTKGLQLGIKTSSLTLSLITKSMCEIELSLGDIEEAEKYADKIVSNQIFSDNNFVQAGAYQIAGKTFAECNRLADAEIAFLKGLQLFTENSENSPPQNVLFYNGLAEVYSKLGQYDKADHYRSLSSAIIPENNLANFLNKITNNRLWDDYRNGKREEIITDISRLEQWGKASVGDTFNPWPIHYLYAQCAFIDGDGEKAINEISQSLKTGKGIESSALATHIYSKYGSTTDALGYAADWLILAEEKYGSSSFQTFAARMAIIDLFLRIERMNHAEPHFIEAYNVATKYVSDNLLTLTADQRQDLWKSIYDFFRTYIPNSCYKYGANERMNRLLYNSMLFSNGLLLSADKEIFDMVKQSSEETRHAYSEWSSAKSWLKKLNENLQFITDMEQIERYQQEIEQQQETVGKAERKMMTLLRAEHGEEVRTRIYSWKDVRDALPADAAAIEFVDFAENADSAVGMALVLRPDMDSPQMRVVYHRPTAYNLVTDSLYHTTALGDSLITSLQDLLAGCNDIYFSPQGPLCAIAIESLPRSESSLNPAVRLHRLSSTRVLAEKHVQHNIGGATLFGGLNYTMSVDSLIDDAGHYPQLRDRAFNYGNLMRAQLNRKGTAVIEPLPGTRTEVESIAGIISRRRQVEPVCKKGVDGTESAFKALSGRYGNILHVSTHGFFNDAIPLGAETMSTSFTAEDIALEQSGLLLAGAANRYINGTDLPDQVDDGILKASEIARLNLNDVELAVLSACETGLGHITGDGVFGLQRGFKKAGAQALLMSLRKVDDDATCALMTAFYDNWLSGKSKYEALEEAKATIRNTPKWSDPKFWAYFILMDALD